MGRILENATVRDARNGFILNGRYHGESLELNELDGVARLLPIYQKTRLNPIEIDISTLTLQDTNGDEVSLSTDRERLDTLNGYVKKKGSGTGGPTVTSISFRSFESEAARDAFFSTDDGRSHLRTGLPILVTIDPTPGTTPEDAVVHHQIWGGANNPSTYDNTQWVTDGVINLNAEQIKMLYESNNDTNALTDAKLAILNLLTIEDGSIVSSVDIIVPFDSLGIGDSILSARARIITARSETTGNEGAFVIQLIGSDGFEPATVFDPTQTETQFNIQTTENSDNSGGSDINVRQVVQNDVAFKAIDFMPMGGVISGDFTFTIRLATDGRAVYQGTISPLDSNLEDRGSGVFRLTFGSLSVFDANSSVYIEITGITLLGGNGFDGSDNVRFGDTANNNFFPWLRSLSVPVVRQLIATEDQVDTLQRQVTALRQSQAITRGSFDTFNDSFVINNVNAAINGGRVNIYAAKIDKIVNVTLPTTAHLVTAGLGYPYGTEFVHSAGSGRLTTNNILRIDAGSSQTGDLIDQPILQNPAVPSQRVQMFQGDIGLFVKDDAASNYRYLQGVFDPIAEITRQGVFAFRNDHVVSDIDDIETDLGDVTINQGDAFLVQAGGTRFGYNISDGDVILAKVNNPSLASNSDDWLHFADSSQALTSDQMAFFGNVDRTGTRFDLSRNVFVDASNVEIQSYQATGSGLNDPVAVILTNRPNTSQTLNLGTRNIRFSDLVGGRLMLMVSFTTADTQGFPPEPTTLRFTYGSTVFEFPISSADFTSNGFITTIDIPNEDYSSILNTDPVVELDVNFRGISFLGTIIVNNIVNTLKGDLYDPIVSIANIQDSTLETKINTELNKIRGEVDVNENNLGALSTRVSPYVNIQNFTPEIDARFLDSTGSDAFPTPLSALSQVSADNPRFTGGNVALYVAVPAIDRTNYTLRNITQNSDLALDSSEATVTLGESLSDSGITYFVYRVTGLTSGDVYEVESTENVRQLAWPNNIASNKREIDKLDAALEHAALNLPEDVVQVLENDVAVTEETTPTVVSSDYNNGLGNNGTQKIFYEASPNAPSGGSVNSKPINENLGNDRHRRKLIYLPEDRNYPNQDFLIANNGGAVNTPLISFRDGAFYGKQLVPAIPSGVRTETVYPAPATKVSGPGIWQTISILTFVGDIPEDEASELFFTRNLPPASTEVTIQYRGHANSLPFGEGTATLAANQNSVSFSIDDVSEVANVEVARVNGQIRVRVTDYVRRGIPTINDVQVILSFSRTVTVPAVPESVREIRLEDQHTGYQVFAMKPSSGGNIILVGSETEYDTGYAYTTIFGAAESGFLSAVSESAQFLDFQNIEPIDSTIIDLQNHAILPQLGLFTTNYTHSTEVNLDTQLNVKDSLGNTRNALSFVQDVSGTLVRAVIEPDGSGGYRLRFDEIA